MKKALLNFWVDFISFINILIIGLTGFVLKFCFPRGPGGKEFVILKRTFLGLSKGQWGDIHFILAQIFCLLLVFHIYLHWTWIKNIFLNNILKNPCFIDVEQSSDIL